MGIVANSSGNTVQLGNSHTHQDTAFALLDPNGECKAVLPRGTSANDARTMARLLRLKLVLAEVEVTMTYSKPVESANHKQNYEFTPEGFGE